MFLGEGFLPNSLEGQAASENSCLVILLADSRPIGSIILYIVLVRKYSWRTRGGNKEQVQSINRCANAR